MTVIDAIFFAGLVVMAGVLVQLIHYTRWIASRMNALSDLLKSIKAISDAFETSEEIYTADAMLMKQCEIEVLTEDLKERKERVDMLEGLLDDIGVPPDEKYSLSDIQAVQKAVQEALK